MLSTSDTLVSIIIPVYNTEKYVQECVKSVISQSYSNLEVIVINDGSTDNSAEIFKEDTKDPRVLFIDRENRGLSYTRQQGIDMAHGEYFCTLDADDMYDPCFIEKMLCTVLNNQADICVCGREEFDNADRLEFKLENKSELYILNQERVTSEIRNLSSELWLPDSWNKLYRTAFVRDSGVKYFLNNKYNGTDLAFNNLLILHCPKVCIYNEPLLLHRIVQGSRVHRKNKPLQEGFEIIIDKVFEEASRLGYPKEFYKNYGSYYYKLLEMVLVAILDESGSLAEAWHRIKEFYSRKAAYIKRHEIIMKKYTPSGGTESLYNKLFERCLYGNNIVRAMILYELNRIRRIRRKMHERDKP